MVLGTALYTAPECFLGEAGSVRADLFSLGVICYQLLSGEHPYGTQVARSHTKAAHNRLVYRSLLNEDRKIPARVDETIKRAVHLDPYKRYEAISEFTFDLRHSNKVFPNKARPPLMERNPAAFWKSISLILAIIVTILLANMKQP